MADEKATFGINLDGNAASEATRAASAMDQLRSSISSSMNAVKNASSAMRSLRGSSDEVKQAKEQLKAKIDAERNTISAATLALHKQGTSYEQLSAKSKKFSATTAEVGGPITALKGKLTALTESVSKDGGLGLAMGAVAGVIGIVVAIMGKLASTVVHAGVSLVSFILHAADAARSADLLREAAWGANPHWGANAGEQVAALAKNVPTAKAQIEALGVELAKSNIGGQTWVDTLNAVTQASAALGDDAGNKLKGYVERGKQLGNFQLTPQELLGTGAEWDLVAQIIGAKMKLSVDGAKQALIEGRVKLADGANALREAVERKFGGINLRKMLSLETLSAKFKETLASLTKGVNLEPILTAVKDVMNVFDTSTVSGKALKQMITMLGDAFGSAAKTGAPLLKSAIQGLIMLAQRMVIAYLDVRIGLKNAFSDADTKAAIDTLKEALDPLVPSVESLGLAVSLMADDLKLTIRAAAAGVAAFKSLNNAFEGVKKMLAGWDAVGISLVEGLISGITGKVPALVETMKNMGKTVKDAFTSVLKIESPSKVFEQYGRHTTEGYAQGIDRSTSDATSALANMVSGFKPQRAGGGSMSFSFVIQVSGGEAAAGALRDPSLYEQIAKVVTDAVGGAGVPVAP